MIPRCFYRPQRSWGKVIFLEVCFKNSVYGGGGVGGGVSRPRPRGEVGESGWGCLGPHPGGMLGVWPGGVSRPTSREEIGGSGGRGVQAHTWGVVQAYTWGGSRPRPGKCIPACTEADTPSPQQMASAVGGTHPTGMHSC